MDLGGPIILDMNLEHIRDAFAVRLGNLFSVKNEQVAYRFRGKMASYNPLQYFDHDHFDLMAR